MTRKPYAAHGSVHSDDKFTLDSLWKTSPHRVRQGSKITDPNANYLGVRQPIRFSFVRSPRGCFRQNLLLAKEIDDADK